MAAANSTKTATEKTAEAPKETKPDRTALTLQQKFVEIRKAIPAIQQQAHSDGVKYKFAKIYDVYKLMAPALNEWGVNFDITEETATRHAENGDEIYYSNFVQRTRSGDRVVWIYEAELTIRWTNADNPADCMDVTLHAIGTNDSGPDKAKGSAWTYCLKYYFLRSSTSTRAMMIRTTTTMRQSLRRLKTAPEIILEQIIDQTIKKAATDRNRAHSV